MINNTEERCGEEIGGGVALFSTERKHNHRKMKRNTQYKTQREIYLRSENDKEIAKMVLESKWKLKKISTTTTTTTTSTDNKCLAEREREREMEGSKRAEAGTSAAAASVDVVGGGGDEKIEKQSDIFTKNPDEICDDEVVVVGDEENDDFDEKNEEIDAGFVPGPLVSLKEQLEKDEDDESLKRWKEKLLGCLETDLNGQMEPEVTFRSIAIISDDFGELTTPLPISESQSSGLLFTLREGSRYRLKMAFTVQHNIVSGLTYSNTVWKGGLQVDQSKGMLGTFAPQKEPYVHTLEEETTPSGVLARGTYSALLKFEDDDRRCHMELKYSFEIKKSR